MIVYIGIPTGEALGIYLDYSTVESGIPTWLNMSLDSQVYYPCDPHLSNFNYCKRSSSPTYTTPPADLSSLTTCCNENVNKLVFARSYVDVTTPDIDTFYTLLYCFGNEIPSNGNGNFSYYLALDTSVQSISAYLIDRTDKISGSKSFVFESSTNHVVARKLYFIF